MTTINGSIEVICGSMFSGKTEELLRRLKRAQYGRLKIQIFKSSLDTRYSEDHIQSHDASRLPSAMIQKAQEILTLLDDNTRVVGIDEVQFLDHDIIDVAQKLANRGIRVILAGLDQDYKGRPFGPMAELLAIAEEVTKLSAVCTVCGKPASKSQRLIATDADLSSKDTDFENPILVGAQDFYEARCRQCHLPDGEIVSKARMFRALGVSGTA